MKSIIGCCLVSCLVAAPAFAEEQPPANPAVTAYQAVDQQNSEVMKELLARGKKALDRRDISGARALLKPPADYDVAEANRLLAQTYDPRWLLENHIMNASSFANPTIAAELYVAAAKLGDNIAVAKLKAPE